TASATLVGFLYSFAMVRGRFPLKPVFRALAILPLMSPPFIVALSYILLFGGRGLVTYHLLGKTYNIYGWHGLWLVQTISFFPYAYLVIESVIARLNPTLEYAAKGMGASDWEIFRTVIWPLARPGIANAALLVAINVLADFGNPIMIAGQFAVLPTEAYMQISGWYDLPAAAVLCTILLVPALVFFIAQNYWIGRRSYVTVTGRGSTIAAPPLAGIGNAALFAFCCLVGLIIASVYGVLAAGAFTRAWGADWRISLEHWDYVIFRGREVYNSFLYSLLAAACGAVLSILAAYLLQRKDFPARRVLDFTATLPAAVPGIFLGLGYLLSFNNLPLKLTGTAAIIILAFIFWNLPNGYRAGVSSLQQVDRSIEEAAASLGASSMKTFKDVVLPLLRAPFSAAFAVTFVRSITALSVVIFIVSPRRTVATISILGLVEQGYWGRAAAYTTALIVAAFAILGVTSLVSRQSRSIFQV
ncbi:MAG TPA: iron ABC transporter permease, partial [Firmicutes bacterium]|nr:iron ABC transporter permease [Bacillota bacterium]